MYSVKHPLVKSPVSIVRAGINWTQFLESGDTVVTSVWSCDSDDITFSRQQLVGNTASCRIGGGIAGSSYEVFNTITTSSGDIDRRYFVVEIDDTQLSIE